jgi:hypothetical protein
MRPHGEGSLGFVSFYIFHCMFYIFHSFLREPPP